MVKNGKITHGLPAQSYTDQHFWEIECNTVLADGWLFVGFVHEFSKPGDVIPISIAGKPILLIKNNKDEITAFHNVCSHRCLKLVNEKKNVGKIIQCPYHSWTYDLEGKLKASPHFGGTNQHTPKGFNKSDHGLKPIRIHIWYDWIFINLNGKAKKFEEYAKPLIKKFKDIKSWRRSEVLRDFKFYIISLNMLAMPWIVTGVFIYQSFIAESKLWGSYIIPQSFMIYSITSILTLIASGFLVDKFTSRKLIPFMNVPLLFGLMVLYFYDISYSAYIFFGLMGVSNGLANVLGSSTWAEIYGVRYLGAIRALTTALMVFSTAFGTALFGILIDKDYTIENIALISILYISLTLFLLLIIKGSVEPVNLTKKT